MLHYIHDPLCGWCYGAAPLVQAARDIVPVVAHGGGMMTGTHRRNGAESFRQQIAPIAQRIESVTGQRFDKRYVDGLLRDGAAVFDSEAPITAMLTVDLCAAEQEQAQHEASFAGLDMLARIQTAQFIEGRCVAEADVLADLAVEAGLPRSAFTERYAHVAGALTDSHIEASRVLLRRLGGHGFPTFAWELEGTYETIDLGPWLGNVDSWRVWLKQRSDAFNITRIAP